MWAGATPVSSAEVLASTAMQEKSTKAWKCESIKPLFICRDMMVHTQNLKDTVQPDSVWQKQRHVDVWSTTENPDTVLHKHAN